MLQMLTFFVMLPIGMKVANPINELEKLTHRTFEKERNPILSTLKVDY